MQKLNNELLTKFITELYTTNEVKDIDFQNGLIIFLNYVKATKALDTYKFYKQALTYVIDFLEKRNIFSFGKINEKIILEYIKFCNLKNLKNSTINKRTTALKTMMKYLNSIGLIDPIGFTIDKLKETDPKIEIIEQEVLERIIIFLENKPVIHKLMFLLLVSTGVRRRELVYIKIKNINLKDNSIFLDVTKNKKSRFIYFDNKTKLILEEFIRNNKNKFLFCSSKGVQLTPNSVSGIFDRMKKRLNLEVLSPHKFRHTYGTYLIENGADLESVCLLLGHSSYEMTKKYLHLKNEGLKNKSLKFNPLNNLTIKKT